MARWEAIDEYIPNLTSKNFFCIWITRKSVGSDVTGDVGNVSTPGKNVFMTLSILLLVQRRAMVRWKTGNE